VVAAAVQVEAAAAANGIQSGKMAAAAVVVAAKPRGKAIAAVAAAKA
jgi:hypothetical protein